MRWPGHPLSLRDLLCAGVVIGALYGLFAHRSFIEYKLEVMKVDDELNADSLWNNPAIQQDDPRLIKLVREMLVPPSSLKYNFSRPKLRKNWAFDPSAGQSQAVRDILKGFGHDGFFIDCGANDGEWSSNTVWVERVLGWRGVLIEADPRPYSKLVTKHRKAYLGNFCLSNTTFPQIVPFYINPKKDGQALGSGLIRSEAYRQTHPIMVKCIPLYSVMLALGRTTVDFFSLDVEGSEMDILRTLPDDAIFKVITIEHNTLREGKLGLRRFMEGKGYIFYRTVADARFIAGDSIFVHKSVTLTEAQKAIVGFDNDTFTRSPRI